MKNWLEDVIDDHGVAMGCLAILLAVVLVLGITFGSLCLEAWLVMLLWNWLAVEIFAFATIGFWQAFGILLICNILFGGVRTIINHKGE